MQEEGARPYHHGDLKRVTIETALNMLSEEKGWQFALREVARLAGVSNFAPYKHFPDKTTILAELATRGFDQLRKAVDGTLLPQPRLARTEFIHAAKAYIQFGTSNPSLYRLMFSAEVDKAAFRALDEAASCSLTVLNGILERGQQSGSLRRRPARGQAAATWALLRGFTLLSIDGQLLPETIGAKPMDAVLTALLEGLEY